MDGAPGLGFRGETDVRLHFVSLLTSIHYHIIGSAMQ